MGLFLSAAGVAGASIEDVQQALQQYAASRGGALVPSRSTPDDGETLVLLDCGNNKTSILYPHEFYEWDEASSFISSSLQVPVFSFHIHDGDFWMYTLFARGEDVDRYNPVPEYWGELDVDERTRWRGDAEAIASHWPGVKAVDIAKYLVGWDPSATTLPKAYSDDEFPMGQDWQMTDFMRKLGLRYPADESGKALGETFHLTVQPRRHEAETPTPGAEAGRLSKPWWRFW